MLYAGGDTMSVSFFHPPSWIDDFRLHHTIWEISNGNSNPQNIGYAVRIIQLYGMQTEL